MGTGAGWGDLSGLHGTIETSAAQGNSFLRIPLGGGRTPMLYFDYSSRWPSPNFDRWRPPPGWIRVEKGRAYVLSADLGPALGHAGCAGRAGPRPLVQRMEQSRASAATYHGVEALLGPVPAATRLCSSTPGLTWPRTSGRRPRRGTVGASPTSATEFQSHDDLELVIEPSQAAGIFVDGSPAILRLRRATRGPRDGGSQVQATDFSDKAGYAARTRRWTGRSRHRRRGRCDCRPTGKATIESARLQGRGKFAIVGVRDRDCPAAGGQGFGLRDQPRDSCRLT